MRNNFVAKLFVWVVFAVVLCSFGLPLSALLADETGGNGSQIIDYNYTTDSYDVNIVLDKDNVYHVTETIAVNFVQPSHGILRYIPYRGYLYANGANVLYRASLGNISAGSDPFTLSKENGNRIIKIGSADERIAGAHTYNIRYDYAMGKDRFVGRDEILFNILPTQWATAIDKFTFSITLPDAVNTADVALYLGSYGSTNTDGITWQQSGNMLTGSADRSLMPYEGVTLRIPMPDGYFTAKDPCGWMYVLLWCLLAVLPIFLFVLWFFFGRDEKTVQTVEFVAPGALDPAMAGYLIDGVADNKDLVSLLFYWADKGYLSITEEGRGFVLTKLQEPTLPSDYERTVFKALFGTAETARLTRRRSQIANGLSKAREQMESALNVDAPKPAKKYTDGIAFLLLIGVLVTFGLSILVSVVMTVVSMYTDPSIIMSIIAGLYFLVFGVVLLRSLLRQDQHDDYASTVFTRSSRLAQNVAGLLSGMPMMAAGFISAYASGGFPSHLVLYPLLWALFAYLVSQLRDFVDTQTTRTGWARAVPFIQLTGIVVCWALFVLIAYRYYQSGFIMLAAVACSAICLFFTLFMKKRTDIGQQYLGSLLGLRQFIEFAEKGQLEALVAQDPAYFYHVLPYAYVLGVTDTWCRKFEDIVTAAPQWYSGDSFSAMEGAAVAACMHHAVVSMCHEADRVANYAPPVSTGSSGGSSGGWSSSCSSSGGGGGSSSGGGGGGGGGHSW